MRLKNLGERERLLELCFECFCENGIEGTSSRMLAEACGMSSGNIFHYFQTKDEIIIKATAHCMEKVEDEFMANAPKNTADVKRFLREIPYWTAQKHGSKYRFMYQVYTSPKYRNYGKEFFRGVRERYTEYAKELSPKFGVSWQALQPIIYTFVRACVHYALFEDEEYLRPQISLIEKILEIFLERETSRKQEN